MSQALKPIQKYLLLAKRLEQSSPLVSYYCRMHAVQVGMKLPGKTADDKKQLFSILDQLEVQKASIDQQLSEADCQAECEQKALQVFAYADSQDRSGAASKKTAMAFLDASSLFEICRQFGELAMDVEEKLKYAKWKAGDITKALREGRVPTPGGLADSIEDESGGAAAPSQATADNDRLAAGSSNSSQAAASLNGHSYAEVAGAHPAAPSASALSAPSPFPAFAPNPPASAPLPASSPFPVFPSSAPFSAASPAPVPASAQYFPAAMNAPGGPRDFSAAQPMQAHSASPLGHAPAVQSHKPNAPAAQNNAPAAKFAPAPAPASAPAPARAAVPSFLSPTAASVPMSSVAYQYQPTAGNAKGSMVITANAKLAGDRDEAVRVAEDACKQAMSALRFDDVQTALERLRTAMEALVAHS